MLTASKPLADRYGPPSLRFKGHAPIYPVCWIYNNTRRRDYVFKELTGAPAFIQGGELDGDVTSSIVRPPNASSRILLRTSVRAVFVRTAPTRIAAAMARETTVKSFCEVFAQSK